MSWDHATGWPDGAPRILLTDCWMQNAGDAAIAAAMQRMIHRFAPGAAVVHAAYGVGLVGDRYPELVLVPPLDALLGTRWVDPDRTSGIDGPAFVAEADLVISQGGGFLREGYQPWARIDALLRATELVGGISLLGQTIGVFDRTFAREAFRGIMRRAHAVLVRDRHSGSSAVDLGADPAIVHLGTDFSLDMVESALLEPDRGSVAPPSDARGVGVVLSDHVVPGESADRAGVGARLLEAVLERSGSDPVTVWSSSQGIPRDSEDDVVASAAVELLSAEGRRRITVVPGHLDAYDVFRWSRAFPSLVSMRFHPALLAAAQGIPSVLAMSDPKVAFFDGSPMRDRVVVGHDAAAAERAARMAIPGSGPVDPQVLLGSVWERLKVNQQVVADLLAGVG